MAGMGLRYLIRSARSAVCGALLLVACAEGQPDTGAEIVVMSGAGVPVPRFLLFDWKEGERTLVANRRVPEKGFLDGAAAPLAVVRIASTDVGAERQIIIRGMIEDEKVSEGSASVRIVAGSWPRTTVVLGPEPVIVPDGGAPDGQPAETGEAPDADSPDAGPEDAAGDLPAQEVQPDPPDAGAPDLPIDAQLPRDLAPEAPPSGPVTIAPTADSYVEQGQTSTGMNFGKATVLEVKTQNGADNNRVAYLRFPLAAITGTPALTATLRIYGKASTGTNSDSAFAVMDDTWTETAINWTNKPALGAKQSSVSIGTTAQYREWNVLAFVRAQQAAGRPNVSLAVSMDMDTAAAPDTFNSREAASNPPQLVVTR